jgi:MFS transporter, PAT family, solute carrier family 33 (acetyl-CoA transportor), member 1
MSFFAQISDPAIGGTYMTLLNTIANLGSKWPTSISLALLDYMTFRTCKGRQLGSQLLISIPFF